jgi:hypothetical protein
MHAASVILFSLLLTSCSAFQWKECPNEHSELQTIANVELVPEPVPVGSTAKFTIAGNSSRHCCPILVHTRTRRKI